MYVCILLVVGCWLLMMMMMFVGCWLLVVVVVVVGNMCIYI